MVKWLKSTISHIAIKLEKQQQLCVLNCKKPKFHHRRRRHYRATSCIVPRITSHITPPTISLMSVRCHISVGTMFRMIRDIIYVKCHKKASTSTLSNYY